MVNREILQKPIAPVNGVEPEILQKPIAPVNGVEPRILLVGGSDRDRTDDLLHAMQALSQLSYRPLID